MPQSNAINMVAVSLLLGMTTPVLADAPQQVAQAQQQNRSQIEQDYQNRLRAAKTPEERAQIQAEYDRMMQQGAVPNSGSNVRTGPGTADSPGATGGGSVPRGQSGSGSTGDDSGAGGGAGGSGGSGGGGGGSR